MLRAIAEDARTYRKWFDFLSAELMSSPQELSAYQFAERFCGGPNEINGRAVGPEDHSEIQKILAATLIVAEKCRLVAGSMHDRYTPNLRLLVRERVASLTPKGARLTKAAPWRRELTFAFYISKQLVRGAWKPFAAAVAAASTVGSLLKLVLLWDAEKVAIASAFVGLGTLLGAIFRPKH